MKKSLILIFVFIVLFSCAKDEKNPFTGGIDSDIIIDSAIEFDNDIIRWTHPDGKNVHIRVEFGSSLNELTHFAYETSKDYTSEHEVKLFGYEKGREYHFRIKSIDTYGNTNFYSDSDTLFTIETSSDENLFKYVLVNVNRGVCIGDCMYMRLPTGEDFLIDAGLADKVSTVKSFLRDENAEEIEYAWFTHCHGDHFGGFEGYGKNGENYYSEIESSFIPADYEKSIDKPVGLWFDDEFSFINFYYPPNSVGDYSNTYSRLKSKADAQCQNTGKLLEGDEIILGEVEIKILHSGAYTSNENNSSIAAYLKYRNLDMLLGGDAEHPVESKLVDNYPDIISEIDFFKVHHHGRFDANDENFLGFMSAVTCGIPVDEQSSDSDYSSPLPSPSVIEDLEFYGTHIFRLDKTDQYSDEYQYGNINLLSDGYYYTIFYE